jgi:hypothetical protein
MSQPYLAKIGILGLLVCLGAIGCQGENPDNSTRPDWTDDSSDSSLDTDSEPENSTATDSDTGTEAGTDTETGSESASATQEPGTATDTDSGPQTCDDDLDCPSDQFCDNLICVDQVCDPGATRCVGEEIFRCDANGGGESLAMTCESTSYFESTCDSLSDDLSQCGCEDDWDCPAHTICEVGQCMGTGKEPTCSLPPEPFRKDLLVLEIQWGGTGVDNKEAVGSPFPLSAQVVMAPIVANLDDDNGDGLINERDFPEIIFATFCNSAYTIDGVLRAIHGGGPDKGKDFFATCGSKVWKKGDPLDISCECADADLNSTASLAVGDLDGDGVPEIVAMLEGKNGGLAIYSNTGDIISKSADLNMNYSNPGIALANLDNKGFAEIIIGRHVFTLIKNEQGALVIDDRFEGTQAHGTHGQGPLSCVANLTGDSRQEIIAATSVYSLPSPPPGVTRRAECAGPYGDDEYDAFCDGKLRIVWDGMKVNPDLGLVQEGFCAIADVWGADHVQAPSPSNPLDGEAEVITVSEGNLQIFEGATGKLLQAVNLGAGTRGGPPNVDDFDGDGFPEIGTAFATSYIVIDLQKPTKSCPEWTIPFDDNYTGSDPLQGNSPRNENCLHNGWRRKTEDDSSRVTGSSVFDFNGDGAAEVIYNDECYFRIYDGRTGKVLFDEPSESRTRIEYPIVADVDNDGNAEIIFGVSNESGFCSEKKTAEYNNGIEIWGDASDTWVSARRIWNQHAYHVTNVREDGGIPLFEPESWKTYNDRIYNTYRSNPRGYGTAPDLVVSGLQISSPDAGCGTLSSIIRITARVQNIGDSRVGPGVKVAFHGEWDTPSLDTPLLDADKMTPLVELIGKSLEPTEGTIVSVLYTKGNNAPAASKLPARVRVVVDDGNQERECDETNNERSAEVVPGKELPDLSIELGAVQETCPTPTVHTIVRNLGTAPAFNVVVRYYAGDPEQGGLMLHQKIIAGMISPGGTVDFNEPISGFPVNVSVLIYGKVDPDNVIEECDDSNNLDSADAKVLCGLVY